ncbi:MAG: GTP cyclohydrolase II [Pseudomonadota bacterium]
MAITSPFGDTAQRAVLRAAHDLRCGWPVRVAAGNATALVVAVEVAGEAARADVTAILGGRRACLLTSARRARALGLPVPAAAWGAFALDEAGWARLLDLDPAPADLAGTPVEPRGLASSLAEAAVELCRIAELLPMLALWLVDATAADDLAGLETSAVEARAVLAHRGRVEGVLEPATGVPLPLADAPDTRVLAFRQPGAPAAHLAFLVGDVEGADAPLCRLHSACFTGDVLGSLRCDCGEQLRGALRRMHEAGAGVLLYLAHEGRGIGLLNKLRAYRLQDAGADTLDANHLLGFAGDERDYAAAATMLKLLGIERVRLLSNNPAKVEALAARGIDVVERLGHAFPANAHNRRYLATKAVRGGHDLDAIAPSLEDPDHG